jgi:hypothetical protein
VCGLDTVPDWPRAGQLLDAARGALEAAYPQLAVTIALYPGSTVDALEVAAETASLVVLGHPLGTLSGAPVLVATSDQAPILRLPLRTGN